MIVSYRLYAFVLFGVVSVPPLVDTIGLTDPLFALYACGLHEGCDRRLNESRPSCRSHPRLLNRTRRCGCRRQYRHDQQCGQRSR